MENTSINEKKTSTDDVSTNGYASKNQNIDFKEIKLPILGDWGHISGKLWGPEDKQPIVAIHGWQDNAGTFDNLVPFLPSDLSILCIDLPGHGFSSHLPKGQFYYIFWDGILVLRRIVKYYKWKKVKLLGHSLGGAIGFLYAAAFPNEVEFLISLDIASPSVRNVEKIAEDTGVFIDRFLKYETLTEENMPNYEYDEMIEIVEHAYPSGMTREGAEILMKRGMQPHGDGTYYFSRDPRLKVSLLGTLSMDLVLAHASRITCAYLNIRAIPGLIIDHPENYEIVMDRIKQTAKKFEYHEVEGTHHVHLIEPEKIAPIILKFLQ